ncbi:arginase [Alsobacter sp. SYSU M60028]|uniref:Arginase n=1 Tax=Alsobacter ponti TaxID=2962936 RepID=A0ABT1L6R1_9HYPH|nr:arginase [Alsobacter ponti]MCP8937096.1 arginase [Alsobacter ponti]
MPASAAKSTIALIGVPLELGAGAAGTVMGPAALRTAGLRAAIAGLGHHVVDEGDMDVPHAVPEFAPGELANCRNLSDVAAWTGEIHDRALSLLASGALPIFMGGDHSIAMGTISAVSRFCAEAGRRLVVLWLDAHADFNTPATSPSGNMHGMSVAFLCGEPSLTPVLGERAFPALAAGDIHLFGVRSVDAEERRTLVERGVDCVDMRMIDEFGMSALLRGILDGLDPETTHLHVSFDVDFLDPELAPGTGTTVPGGATYREAHLVMEMLHDSGLVRSLDIVELNPFLDDRGKSARVAVDLVGSLFGRSIVHRPSPRA